MTCSGRPHPFASSSPATAGAAATTGAVDVTRAGTPGRAGAATAPPPSSAAHRTPPHTTLTTRYSPRPMRHRRCPAPVADPPGERPVQGSHNKERNTRAIIHRFCPGALARFSGGTAVPGGRAVLVAEYGFELPAVRPGPTASPASPGSSLGPGDGRLTTLSGARCQPRRARLVPLSCGRSPAGFPACRGDRAQHPQAERQYRPLDRLRLRVKPLDPLVTGSKSSGNGGGRGSVVRAVRGGRHRPRKAGLPRRRLSAECRDRIGAGAGDEYRSVRVFIEDPR